MESIKKFFSSIWAIVLAIFGILLFFLYKNKDKVSKLGADLKKANTEKEVALIDSEVTRLKKDMGIVLENNKKVEKLQEDIQKKKDLVEKQQANKSDKEIEDYWKDN